MYKQTLMPTHRAHEHVMGRGKAGRNRMKKKEKKQYKKYAKWSWGQERSKGEELLMEAIQVGFLQLWYVLLLKAQKRQKAT